MTVVLKKIGPDWFRHFFNIHTDRIDKPTDTKTDRQINRHEER